MGIKLNLYMLNVNQRAEHLKNSKNKYSRNRLYLLPLVLVVTLTE